ncbi:MAG: hypothetical protein ACXWZV_00850 [Solirubrobacterales bacterium]
MKRAMCAILLVALALALAACGGDDDGGGDGGGDDSEAVAETMRAYLTAYSEGDGAEACTHLTEGAQQALAESAKTGKESCAEALSRPSGQGSDILGPLIEGIDAEDVTVDGDTAELTIEGTPVPASLEKVDGEWLVTEDYVRESFQLGGS